MTGELVEAAGEAGAVALATVLQVDQATAEAIAKLIDKLGWVVGLGILLLCLALAGGLFYARSYFGRLATKSVEQELAIHREQLQRESDEIREQRRRESDATRIAEENRVWLRSERVRAYSSLVAVARAIVEQRDESSGAHALLRTALSQVQMVGSRAVAKKAMRLFEALPEPLYPSVSKYSTPMLFYQTVEIEFLDAIREELGQEPFEYSPEKMAAARRLITEEPPDP